MLKLKQSMLKQLGIKQDTTYYACSEEYEQHAVKGDKRMRWSEGAQLKVGPSDLTSDVHKEYIAADHPYNTGTIYESEKVESLDMGDFFLESGELNLREETVEDERAGEEAGEAACSQESSCGVLDSGDDEDESFNQSTQSRQKSSSQNTTLDPTYG